MLEQHVGANLDLTAAGKGGGKERCLFLLHDKAAACIVQLASDPDKAVEMGSRGREKVRQNFLMSRLLEQHLDLLSSFEGHYVPTL